MHFDPDTGYAWRRLSSKSYVLDLNPVIREYLKSVGHTDSNVRDREVWVVTRPGTGAGRWGKTKQVFGTEAEAKDWIKRSL